MPSLQLGRYRLIERLGSGGMGVVYRALSEGPRGFSRPCVIKRIRPTLARDPDFINMLVVEARLSAMLRHPGILQVYELGEAGGEYFLVMEYIEGADLSTVMRHCSQAPVPIPEAVVCQVIAEVAAALGYAHGFHDEQGRPCEIVHRDVSPSNVMLAATGGTKLLDFGIAKAARHVRDEETRTGTLKGKIGYMAPEQAEGLGVDRRSDLFALGIIAWECLTGRRLFRGDDDFQTLRMVKEAKVAPPSSHRAGLDPDLESIVLTMLQREPEQRYQTGEALVEALSPVARRLGGDPAAVAKFLASIEPLPRKVQPLTELDKLGAVEVIDEDDPTRLSPISAPPTRPPQTGTVATPPPVSTQPLGVITQPFVPEPPSRRPAIITMSILGAVAFAGTVWAIARRPADPPPAPVAAGEPATVAPAAAAVTAPPTTAAVTPPSVISPSTAAHSAAVEPPSNKRVAERLPPRKADRAPTPAARGTVRIKATPWAEIRIDGQLVGVTPLAPRSLPAGEHEIAFTYKPEGGVARTRRKLIQVRGHAEQLVEADLRTP